MVTASFNVPRARTSTRNQLSNHLSSIRFILLFFYVGWHSCVHSAPLVQKSPSQGARNLFIIAAWVPFLLPGPTPPPRPARHFAGRRLNRSRCALGLPPWAGWLRALFAQPPAIWHKTASQPATLPPQGHIGQGSQVTSRRKQLKTGRPASKPQSKLGSACRPNS